MPEAVPITRAHLDLASPGSIENFDFGNAYGTATPPTYDPNVPFDDAQFGIREAK